MKYAFLSFVAAACSVLTASALDATNARLWLSEDIQPDFSTIGGGIASEKNGTAPAYARSWQYVSIPVNVEGKAKGTDRDAYPHFIPELKVRISLAVATSDDKGKPTDKLVLLQKDVTYVDVPLAKAARKAGTGEGTVNVGVFISPSSAFKLAPKDGVLSKKLVAVAVEATFNGSSCNRAKEKANDGICTAVVGDDKEGMKRADKWWRKSGGSTSGASLAAISETPFVHQYAGLGMPATRPLFGPAESGSSAAPALSPAPADADSPTPSPTSTTATEGTDTGSEDTGDVDGGGSADSEDAEDGKSGKRTKRSRRSRR